MVGIRVAVQAVLDQRPAQGGAHTGVHDKHRARELGAPSHIQEAQILTNLPVGHPLVLAIGIRVPVFVADHDIVSLSQPLRRMFRRDVGHPQQDLPDLSG